MTYRYAVARVGEFPEVLNLESFQESFRKVSGNIGSLVKLHQLHGIDCIFGNGM